MRILDIDRDKPVAGINLYLTEAEARHLRDAIDGLLTGVADHHVHVNDDAYQREVTVAIYSEDNLEGFDARSIRLIKEGV